MKRKEVEDVIGGKDAWANVDRADGESCGISFILCFGGEREGREEQGGKGRGIGVWGLMQMGGGALKTDFLRAPSALFAPLPPNPFP